MGDFCNYDELIHDESCVLIDNNLNLPEVWLYSLSSDCDLCPFTRISEITGGKNQSLKFNTARSLTWRIKSNGAEEYSSSLNVSDVICELIPNLEQFGIYELNVDNNNCQVTNIQSPSSLYMPLIIVACTIICLLGGGSLLTRCVKAIREEVRDESVTSEIDKSTPKRRVKSIDTFRGISILTMIFVNDGAGGYTILEHATWDGLLVGDLVFPSFMWIMGLCLPISIGSQLSRRVSRFSICKGIVRRSLVLFLLGISLNTLGTNSQVENIRIFGVLQRFSIAYLFVGLNVVLLTRRQCVQQKRQFLQLFTCVLVILPHWIIIFGVVVLHCVITFHLPVPSCPTGYLGPGGRHADGKYYDCVGGAAGYIDRRILGLSHVYQWPTIDAVYGSGPFDPEGILGCLSSIFQVFLGVQAGIILRYHKDWKSHVFGWLACAVICASIGLALHTTNVVPINKNLWSMSFVLVTSSFAFLLLILCYLLVDVTEFWKGGPFRIPGMNALLVYIGHQLCYQIFPFHWNYGGMKTHAWLLVESLWGVFLWTLVAYVLHSRKFYLAL